MRIALLAITQKPLLLGYFKCDAYPLMLSLRSICTPYGALNSKIWILCLGGWARQPKKAEKTNFSISESRGKFFGNSWDHNK